MKKKICVLLVIILMFGSRQAGVTAFAAEASAVTYTIAFNSNGGSGTMKSVSAKYGKSKKLPANTFKKTGYNFKNWNTKKDGSGKTYANSASVKNLTSKKNAKVTFYAQWSLKKGYYKITYKLNGGKNNSKNPNVYSKSQTVKLQNPSKTGYVFKGWYSDSKLSKKVTAIKTGSTGSKTFYAKWAAAKYTIVFNANGGTGKTKELSATYDKSVKLTANGFKKTGYSFSGWNTKQNGSGKSYANKASVKNLTSVNGKKVTLYAQWKQKLTDQTELNDAIDILHATCEPANKWYQKNKVSSKTRNIDGTSYMLWSCSKKEGMLDYITAYSGQKLNKILGYTYCNYNLPVLTVSKKSDDALGFSRTLRNGSYDFANDPAGIKILWQAYSKEITKAQMEARMNQKISEDVYNAVLAKYSYMTDYASRGNDVVIIYGKNASGKTVAKYAGSLYLNMATNGATYNFVGVNPANSAQYGKTISGTVIY